MKDKKTLLKLACIIELIIIAIYLIYYVFFTKFNDETIANIFFCFIDGFIVYLLYMESKKELSYLKQNNLVIKLCSLWLLFKSIIPGILGFIFISSLKDKKNKVVLPEIKKERSISNVITSIISIIFFILIMFVCPRFSFFNKVPKYIIYILIFCVIILLNFKQLKNDAIIFVKNIKKYIPYILKRYLIMLGVMFLVAIPIAILNNGSVSSNQEMLNGMFKKVPILAFLLSTLYAPLVEETVFRLDIFNLIKNEYLFIIISGILFGTLHMIDKFTSIYDLLYIAQYSALGICLAKAYHDSKNIFTSISMHFIQNFLAAVLSIMLFR